VSHKDLFDSNNTLPHSSTDHLETGRNIQLEKTTTAPATPESLSTPTSPTRHNMPMERSTSGEEWSRGELKDSESNGSDLNLLLSPGNKGQGEGLFKRENATPSSTPSKNPAYSTLQIDAPMGEAAASRRSASGGRGTRFCRNFLCSMGHLQLCCGCFALASASHTLPYYTAQGESSNQQQTLTPLPREQSARHTKETASDAFKGNPTSHEVDLLGFHYALLWLSVLTVMISLLSDMISSSIEEAAEDINMSGVFLAAIVLPIVGNAAEHASAISFAMRNKMDVTIGLAVGSSTQIALCVLPLLVLLGWCGGCDMSLNFGAFESVTLMVSVIGVTFATKDGTSNWLLGLLLIAAYFIVAIGFYAHKNDSLK